LQCRRAAALTAAASLIVAGTGCGGGRTAERQDHDFFTSGSRDADQRASQRMARSEQLSGSGEGSGERGVRQISAVGSDTNGVRGKASVVEGKLALFDRLGGEVGISNIISDFMPRALDDPRVNWSRKDVKRGGFSIHRGQSVTWDDRPEHVELLKTHLIQFIELATGGPSRYEGKEIKPAHAYMHISNTEFDAAIGDLKASLDRLKIANKEQKELLAIVESTRPEIVTER
jgi:hemoglobin